MASIEYLKQFDPAQFFRFFVDGRFQKRSKYNGWIGYEAREPGSVQAMLNGFSYMLDNLHAPQGITALYLRNLHQICMTNVQTSNPKSSPGEIRYRNTGLPFFKKTTTYENLVEFIKYRQSDENPMFFDQELGDKPARQLNPDTVFELLQSKGKLTYRAWMPQVVDVAKRSLEGKSSLHAFYQTRHAIQMQIIYRMEELVTQYHGRIHAAQTADEKLDAIAWLVRELETLHPFPDGNCRVFACVLLNQLLLTHDFHPAALLNPNLDFELSFRQWKEEIKLGMEQTRLLLSDPGVNVFEYAISEMPEEQRRQFLGMAKDIIQKVADYDELFLTPDRLQRYTDGKWVTPAPPGLRYSSISMHNSSQEHTLYFATSVVEWKKEQKNIWTELQKCVDKNIRSMVIDDAEYAYGWDIPVLLVPDVMQALVNAAGGNRREANPLTVLITGTEGKTGTKIQLHHVLKQQTQVHARLDSGNTLLPIFGSLASLSKQDRVEINEVSVDADMGKTSQRSKTVHPDICFFSNISAEHMHVHKTLQGVMEHKAAVVDGLKTDGKCIVNSSMATINDFTAVLLKRRPDLNILTFGYRAEDSARLLEHNLDPVKLGWNIKANIGGESVEYFLPLFQHHAPILSVGVLLAVKTLGFDVKKAAQEFDGLRPYESMGFLSPIAKNNGPFLFYDQSRRASISGVRSVFKDIENLKVQGKVVALFGCVSSFKMNSWTEAYHRELAELINRSQVKRLYTTGPNMEIVYEHLEDKSIFVTHSDDFDLLYKSVMRDVDPGDLLVIQGYQRLNLNEIATRILRYTPEENLLNEPDLVGLQGESGTSYKTLLFLKDIAQGVDRETARKTHQVNGSMLPNSDSNFSKYRAALLTKFFTDLDRILPTGWGLQCINDAIIQSGYSSSVHNPTFCEQWFNNAGNTAGLPKKQLFGSFYDFGDPRHIIHVLAGSTNMHIGFVKCKKQAHTYVLEKMDANDYSAIQQRFGRHLPKSAGLEERNWGYGWATIDCGTLIDSCHPKVFLGLYDIGNSQVFADKLKPLLDLVKSWGRVIEPIKDSRDNQQIARGVSFTITAPN